MDESTVNDETPPPPVGAVRSLWRDAVGMAAGLSVIVGTLVSVSQFVEYVSNAKRADLSQRLSSLGQVKQFLADDVEVRRRGRLFVREQLPALLADADLRIRKAGSGEDFYLSAEMHDFAAVHYHYEQLGALVKLGYVEFPLIFEIVAYPDDYMDAVEPLRAAVARHWKGIDKPLPDFGSNIAYLKTCYELSRKPSTKEPVCPPG